MGLSRLRWWARPSTFVLVTALLASCIPAPVPERLRPEPSPTRPVTIQVWSPFSDSDLDAFNEVLARFEGAHPNITVDSVGDQSVEKVAQAIRGGHPPDVAALPSVEQLGQFCASGAWQDLGPYLRRDRVDLGVFPRTVRNYTAHRDQRCAMPLPADVYGLFYNTDAFRKAGITGPPRTTSELAEVAKRLTEWNPDGSIKVAGFLPVMATQSNHPWHWAPHWGARWLDERGRSALGTDPAWAEMFRWQRELIEFYGWSNLVRFTAGLGQTFSADNPFHRGKVAMMIDGEYRTKFIEEQAPRLRYDTAPFPVTDARTDLYGTGFTTGSIVGIPSGAEHPGAAWELVRYLSTNTDAQVRLANGLHNVPSTVAALNDPRLESDPRFRTFLDIFAGGKLASTPQSTDGSAYMKAAEDFADRWQRGRVDDLQRALDELDVRIDTAKSVGG